ncbi:MAG: hypothetical protein EOP09_05195 [Proteobacteria bacterium]|nr:MAG: hypothetical protein EOP09_05195 [Pseudomonadota bacterium]
MNDPLLPQMGTWIAAVGAVMALSLPVSSAHAFSMTTRGNAVAQYSVPLNQSYLDSLEVRKDTSFLDDVIDPQSTAAMRQDYMIRQDSEDRDSRYGNIDGFERRKRDEAMQGYSQGIFDSIQRSYLKRSMKRYQKQAIDLARDYKEPLAVGFLISSIASGREMKLRVSRDVFLKSRAKVQNGTAQVGLEMPGIWTRVAYREPGTDATVSAQIAKQIDERWSAVYDTGSKGTVRLNYGFAF